MISSSGWSGMPGKSNSFYTTVPTDAGSHAKLLFPEMFSRSFGKNLNESVSLKTPSGSQWSVDLKRSKGKVWLQNGWPEFANFYSICFGYLLVFEYKGDSSFQVLIFDTSALEIDYPVAGRDRLNFVKSTEAKKRVLEIEDFSSSDDVVSPCKKTRTKAPSVEASSKLRQEKAKSVNEVVKDGTLALANAFKSENQFFVHVIKKSSTVYGGWSNAYIPMHFKEAHSNWENNEQLILQVAEKSWVFIYRAAKETNCAENERLLEVRSEAEKARVLESVKAFNPEHPNFTVQVKKSYLYGGSMTVPMEFINKHITKDSCSVNLQLPDGRVWSVKCYIKEKCAKFSAGWLDFARKNSLAVGDICAFELVKQRSLNVVIFRVKS
ncbi:hypothetical protein POM88_049839 [Heracleum sosnowskyi]|uniref:TF-B3 domain-containing protein n=1 Tax=Heracleum sosnowskyi TaxID=360622 RepID=A0AAD8M225_9APIA|nr:hypothetical protein POM88_049839 [Heracleum sosnowskyi]